MSLLLAEQHAFDVHYFDPVDRYVGLDEDAQKVDHVHTHLAKITGRKIIHWAEDGWETQELKEQVLDEVLPDLSMYRSQLANVAGMEEDEVLEGAAALRPGILTVPKRRIHTVLSRTGGFLADSIEPMRHGEATGMELVRNAAVHLQFAVESAGIQYGLSAVDLEVRHAKRMVEQALVQGQRRQANLS